MFDIGTGELVVIATVAILVLGPEKCIQGAQRLGRTLRIIQADWAKAKHHFDQVDIEAKIRKNTSDFSSINSNSSSILAQKSTPSLKEKG